MVKLGRDSNHMIAAESAYSIYTEYLKAGFTEEQAFKLLEIILAETIASSVYYNGC